MASKHKPPKERAHVWERPTPAHEEPAPEPEFSGYDVELPRDVHRAKADGTYESVRVNTPDEFEAKLDEGFKIHLHAEDFADAVIVAEALAEAAADLAAEAAAKGNEPPATS